MIGLHSGIPRRKKGGLLNHRPFRRTAQRCVACKAIPNANQLAEMKSLIALLMCPVLLVLSCDLTKHYTNDKGECCDMCEPGTRMSSMATCKDPTCTPCKEDEYQERYTKDVTCSRHPYCDPNLHLESTKPITKKHISLCRCMKDYHCINDRCTTCIPNSPCKPGYKVSENATEMTDTKCVECPPGTFSSQDSFEGNCQLWTECNSVKQEGTTETDRVCQDAKTSLHIGLYIAIVLGIMICICGVCCLVRKGKCEAFLRTQDTYDLCKRKLQKENKPLMNKEDIEAVRVEEPLHRPVAEENEVKDEETARAPVQEGDSRSESHIDTEVRSEGGQPIQQEQGKAAILSQTESCQST